MHSSVRLLAQSCRRFADIKCWAAAPLAVSPHAAPARESVPRSVLPGPELSWGCRSFSQGPPVPLEEDPTADVWRAFRTPPHSLRSRVADSPELPGRAPPNSFMRWLPPPVYRTMLHLLGECLCKTQASRSLTLRVCAAPTRVPHVAAAIGISLLTSSGYTRSEAKAIRFGRQLYALVKSRALDPDLYTALGLPADKFVHHFDVRHKFDCARPGLSTTFQFLNCFLRPHPRPRPDAVTARLASGRAGQDRGRFFSGRCSLAPGAQAVCAGTPSGLFQPLAENA